MSAPAGILRLLLLVLLLAAPGVVSAGESRPEPVLDIRRHQTEYLGPGRELRPPDGLQDLQIAFFGPADPNHPEWGDAWRGALLAVEEANAGGKGPLPFRLVGAWSENPWGSGVADLARLAFGQGVWAVLGGVDGGTTHLAEQIAVKARLPVVSPGGTDPSVNYTNVPWMFTLLATDERIAALLAEALGDEGAWAAVTTTDRDAAAAWRALRLARAKRRACAPLLHVALPVSSGDTTAIAELAEAGAPTVLVLAGATDSARIVVALRRHGFTGRILGGAACGRRPFRERAGDDVRGVSFPLLFGAERPEARAFVSRYRARWGEAPDFLAAHAYDGTRLLVDALRRAGANRALVRDALVALAPWSGVTGRVAWDPTGRNLQPLAMGAWQGRSVRPLAGVAAKGGGS